MHLLNIVCSFPWFVLVLCMISEQRHWRHDHSQTCKTRLGGEDFVGIQDRTCLLEIALIQDDVTKFPLDAKARLGGDQNQVVTVVLSIFHFVEFPTDMFDMYYIPLEFPRNLHHQVSFWCYQKKRDIITHKGYWSNLHRLWHPFISDSPTFLLFVVVIIVVSVFAPRFSTVRVLLITKQVFNYSRVRFSEGIFNR